MSKKTFIVFGLLVVFLAVLIPWLAFRSDGDAARGAQEVPANLKSGQSLFQTNCGTCHTLYAAGTDGNYGAEPRRTARALRPAGRPERDADDRSRPKAASSTRSKTASTAAPRRAGCRAASSTSEQAKEVAEFVARTAGEG